MWAADYIGSDLVAELTRIALWGLPAYFAVAMSLIVRWVRLPTVGIRLCRVFGALSVLAALHVVLDSSYHTTLAGMFMVGAGVAAITVPPASQD